MGQGGRACTRILKAKARGGGWKGGCVSIEKKGCNEEKKNPEYFKDKKKGIEMVGESSKNHKSRVINWTKQ